MWGCEDVDLQVWGCEDVDLQMWGCEDVDQQMRRCEDVDQQMWGCEDVDQQMWRCEDVLQRLLFYEEPFAGALGKKCTPLWREAHFLVKMYKTPQLRTSFGSWDVEKVQAVAARMSIRCVGLLRWFCVTGAALRMTWHHSFVAGAVL